MSTFVSLRNRPVTLAILLFYYSIPLRLFWEIQRLKNIPKTLSSIRSLI